MMIRVVYRNVLPALILLIISVSCSNNSFVSTDKAKMCRLPDGSVVLLNKHSELQYSLTDTLRIACLKGEAFFTIEKSDVPFEVQTSCGVVRVLGTEFSVNTKGDELDVEVESGVVELEANQQKRKVRKGERIVYNDVKKSLKTVKAEFKHHIWTDEFKDDMRALGKDIEKGGKELGKEIKKVGKELKIKL